MNLPVGELGPWQLTLNVLAGVHAEAAGQAVDTVFRQCLELTQARRQFESVYAHGVQTAQATTGLWPLRCYLLA